MARNTFLQSIQKFTVTLIDFILKRDVYGNNCLFQFIEFYSIVSLSSSSTSSLDQSLIFFILDVIQKKTERFLISFIRTICELQPMNEHTDLYNAVWSYNDSFLKIDLSVIKHCSIPSLWPISMEKKESTDTTQLSLEKYRQKVIRWVTSRYWCFVANMWPFLSCRMSRRNSSGHYINFDNRSYNEIRKDFEECSITIPLHHQYVSLKINHNHSGDVNLIKNSLALHVGLSIVENILLQCDCVAY
jgi:hypothetical protein